MYGCPVAGSAETQMGIALKSLNVPRENLVISSKLWQIDDTVNTVGNSRKRIIEGSVGSLRRLQLDYVDIAIALRHDDDTPIEEICRGFNWLIENNKAFYWGTSEWNADQIMQAYAVCDKLNLIKPVVEQPQYSMLCRDRFEVEYGMLFDQYKMGTATWSPLAGGILTGKYTTGEKIEGTRAATWPGMATTRFKLMFEPTVRDKSLKRIQGVCAVAKALKCTPAQLSIAWVLKNKDVSTCILGARNMSQLEENLGALGIIDKITKEVEEKLDSILGKRPKPDTNWKTWSQKEPRR